MRWRKRGGFLLWCELYLTGVGSSPVAAAPSLFETQNAWQIKRFEGLAESRYRFETYEDEIRVYAEADHSMSLLIRSLQVDLEDTPYLCWRWQIDHVVTQANIKLKSGDDYAARVYVAFDYADHYDGFWDRLALKAVRSIYGELTPAMAMNYVWDNSHSIGYSQDNVYTGRNRMLVLQSGNGLAGTWVTEVRDVLADAQQYLGTSALVAKYIAIASDTDNTGESVRAGFSSLRFVHERNECDSK
ncbi:MAG: DUF3047 domain-containing protein [Hahellaceae bacterium]|nr:DUF3047 domain-containing protein [Hahellaceae bacterium]